MFATGWLPFVVLGNFGLGVGMATSQVSAVSIIQHVVPDAVRGRVLSLYQLSMGVGQLLTFPIAVLGQLVTLPVLFPGLFGATLAAVMSIAVGRPSVRRARIRHAV